MMTPANARAALLALATREAKSKRILCYNESSLWSYCPVCATSRMPEARWSFAAVDARNPVDNVDGLMLMFAIHHPHNNQVCLFPLAGSPASGAAAANLLEAAEALQVLNLEARMLGKTHS